MLTYVSSQETCQGGFLQLDHITSSLVWFPFVWLQVIELDLDQLPDGDEVLSILRQEAPPLNIWFTLAVSCFSENAMAEQRGGDRVDDK